MVPPLLQSAKYQSPPQDDDEAEEGEIVEEGEITEEKPQPIPKATSTLTPASSHAQPTSSSSSSSFISTPQMVDTKLPIKKDATLMNKTSVQLQPKNTAAKEGSNSPEKTAVSSVSTDPKPTFSTPPLSAPTDPTFSPTATQESKEESKNGESVNKDSQQPQHKLPLKPSTESKHSVSVEKTSNANSLGLEMEDSPHDSNSKGLTPENPSESTVSSRKNKPAETEAASVKDDKQPLAEKEPEPAKQEEKDQTAAATREAKESFDSNSKQLPSSDNKGQPEPQSESKADPQMLVDQSRPAPSSPKVSTESISESKQEDIESNDDRTAVDTSVTVPASDPDDVADSVISTPPTRTSSMFPGTAPALSNVFEEFGDQVQDSEMADATIVRATDNGDQSGEVEPMHVDSLEDLETPGTPSDPPQALQFEDRDDAQVKIAQSIPIKEQESTSQSIVSPSDGLESDAPIDPAPSCQNPSVEQDVGVQGSDEKQEEIVAKTIETPKQTSWSTTELEPGAAAAQPSPKDQSTSDNKAEGQKLDSEQPPTQKEAGKPQPQFQQEREKEHVAENGSLMTQAPTQISAVEQGRPKDASSVALSTPSPSSQPPTKPATVEQVVEKNAIDSKLPPAPASTAEKELEAPVKTQPTVPDPVNEREQLQTPAAQPKEKNVEKEKQPVIDFEQPFDKDKQKEKERERRRDHEKERERLERQEREREKEREREHIRETERDREILIARENEEARLIWLSLPGNDHPQYYTDTDSDSCYGGGVMGLDLSDEEDKDLDPPLPLTLQEYHPPPSYYDQKLHGTKRKQNDNLVYQIDREPSRSRPRIAVTNIASAGTLRVAPSHLAASPMLRIDDFPIPDSSIRGEPKVRPLFTGGLDLDFGDRPTATIPRNQKPTAAGSGDCNNESESSDSDEETSRLQSEFQRRHGNRGGNRGNKLKRTKGVRWIRRGKLGGWTEARMEKEVGDRVRHRIEAMQKDSVHALLAAMPEDDKEMLAQYPLLCHGLLPLETQGHEGEVVRDARGRLPPSDLSEAARLDVKLGLGSHAAPTLYDEPMSEEQECLTSTSLAPTLLKPAVTARQLLTSHTLRHTFRNPHIGALGKTALDLIESEGVLGRAIGRCWAAMERGGWDEDPEPKRHHTKDDESSNDAEDEMDVDRDALSAATFVGAMNGTVDEELFDSPLDNPALAHVDKLFVTKAGLTVPKLDELGQPIFEQPPSPVVGQDGGDPVSPTTTSGHPNSFSSQQPFQQEPRMATTVLMAQDQRAVVGAALKCLHELAADSREYVERLEEVRLRLAAIKRRRAEVWRAFREWALQKEEKGEGEKKFQVNPQRHHQLTSQPQPQPPQSQPQPTWQLHPNDHEVVGLGGAGPDGLHLLQHDLHHHHHQQQQQQQQMMMMMMMMSSTPTTSSTGPGYGQHGHGHGPAAALGSGPGGFLDTNGGFQPTHSSPSNGGTKMIGGFLTAPLTTAITPTVTSTTTATSGGGGGIGKGRKKVNKPVPSTTTTSLSSSSSTSSSSSVIGFPLRQG